MISYYESLKDHLTQLAGSMMKCEISVISARPLTPQEAIGNPDRTDFPILKGKEFLVEAIFNDKKGQAFTDMPGNFKGTLGDLIHMSLKTNFERALFIAGLNAVMCYFGKASNTIHCKDKEPKQCAEQLPLFVKKEFGSPKIAFVGYQPAMIEKLSSHFSIRVVDLDQDNIGASRFDIVIEGPEKTEDVLSWGDLIFATGSTCVNESITTFLNKKPVVFYGTSVAGFASLYGYRRYCPFSK